jgi:hypothetical protein
MEILLKRLWLIGVFVMSTLAGCAFSTARVDLNYAPDAAKKSPLSTFKPMTIALQVDDQRESAERGKVGDKKNNFGMVTAAVESKKEVTSVIYDALKHELENNNHKVIAVPKDSVTDLIIVAKLKKYWSDFVMHFVDLEMTGIIIADVSIVSPETKIVLGQKTVNGTFTESRQMVLDGAFESALNGALAEFVRSFSRDPTLLDAIRSGSKSSPGG